MTQHFLYSAKARTLSLAQIFRLSDDQAYSLLKSMRWENGEPSCPHCGSLEPYEITTRRIFKCRERECRRQFSLTSGTIFASHKLPLRDYLAAIAIFVNGAKGVSALQLGRDLNISYKSAFVLAHKLREAMAADQVGTLDGTVEIDGGYFGGFIKQANLKAERIDQRYSNAKTGKRKAVVVLRERGGRTATAVFPHEGDSAAFILSRVASSAIVHTDEGRSWDRLRHHYAMKRVNHSVGYSLLGCTNQAESYFSRLRRAEIGVHHNIAGVYLDRYATEMAWREDHRRRANGEQFECVATLALRGRKSAAFARYWQRSA